MAMMKNISNLIDDMGRHGITLEELSRAALVSEITIVNKLQNNDTDIADEEFCFYQFLIRKVCEKRRRAFGSASQKRRKYNGKEK
jgi:hypothetical protein